MSATIIDSVLAGKLESDVLLRWINNDSLEDVSEDCVMLYCSRISVKMNSVGKMSIKIKEELHEEVNYDDNGDEQMDALFSNDTVKLENETKKELLDDVFANEIDDNTKYLCELCNSYFPNLSFLQEHMQSHVDCDEKSNDNVKEETIYTEVEDASVKGNHRKKPDGKQEGKCNEKKTKRKRQFTEGKDDGISLPEYVDENNSDAKLVNLIKKDQMEASEETLPNPVCNDSHGHAETLDGNNQISNGLFEAMNAIDHDHTKKLVSKELATENVPSPTQNVPNQNFFCNICKKPYVTRKYLKKHISKSHKSALFCDVCLEMFSCKDNLVRHVKRVHLGIKETEKIPPQSAHTPNNFDCNFCNRSFETNKKVKKHIYNIHQIAVFCDVCKKKFSRKDSLARHVQVHLTSDQKFDCNLCSKSFETTGKLQRHKYNCHGRTRSSVFCDVCQKKFSKKGNLDQHVKQAHLGMKVECKFCGESYADSYLLRHSMLSCPQNKNKKPKSCKICGRNYVTQKRLEMHMADHQKYICDYCDNNYYFRYLLERHIKRIHLNVR